MTGHVANMGSQPGTLLRQQSTFFFSLSLAQVAHVIAKRTVEKVTAPASTKKSDKYLQCCSILFCNNSNKIEIKFKK
jgi:hypothetical protein